MDNVRSRTPTDFLRSLTPTDFQSTNNRLCIAKEEWIAIQRYVGDVARLPRDEDALTKWLGSPAPDRIRADMTAMLALNNQLQAHCTAWTATTYPKVVAIATAIHDHAQKARIFYAPIHDLVQRLDKDPPDEAAKAKLMAILASLTGDAEEREKHAREVHTLVKQFADQTAVDREAVSRMYTSFDKNYGTANATLIQNVKDLEALTKQLKATQDQYNHDTVVAATTPSYAWVPLVGLICGVVIAGVYGDRAVKGAEEIKRLGAKIAATDEENVRMFSVMAAANLSRHAMDEIQKDIQAALPALQHVQGVWAAMADNLKNVQKIIDTDIRRALNVIRELGVQRALDQWAEIQAQASAFRDTAYISVKAA